MHIKTFILLYKKPIILAFGIIFGSWLIVKYTGQNTKKEIIKHEIIDCDRSKYATQPISPSNLLNDKNDIQLLHAQTNGLKRPYYSNAEFEADSAKLHKDFILIPISNCTFYHLKELTHSHPYVVPEMADLLNEIGYIFKSKLKEKNQDEFRFLITSALRTAESQENLSKRNRNASTQSAHLFGTTVDISYKEFFNVKKDTIESSAEAIAAMTETLQELREQCKVLVVRERHQACFHMTVVKCDARKVEHEKKHQ